MPIPKGIQTPEVRARFVADRSAKLAQYDALRASGEYSANQAARAVGVSNAGIQAMRHSIERLTGGEARFGRGKGEEIDLGLAILACLRKPGETLTDIDIAAWCNCSRTAIWNIEQRALRKLRQRLMESVQGHEMAEEVAVLFDGQFIPWPAMPSTNDHEQFRVSESDGIPELGPGAISGMNAKLNAFLDGRGVRRGPWRRGPAAPALANVSPAPAVPVEETTGQTDETPTEAATLQPEGAPDELTLEEATARLKTAFADYAFAKARAWIGDDASLEAICAHAEVLLRNLNLPEELVL